MQQYGKLVWTVILILMGCAVNQVNETVLDKLDKERLLSHVETLASDDFQGRETGTEGGLKAAAYVLQEMEGMNLEPCMETMDQPFEFPSRRDAGQIQGTNLVGMVSGTGQSPETIVVTAHFDHLGVQNGDVFNGADDNASGTGALLELARYFTLHPPRHTIIFAGLDAEESGLQGARALLGSRCVSERAVVLNINLDMISRSATKELYVAGTSHYPTLKLLFEGISVPEGVLLKFGHDTPGTGSQDWTFSSDHGPFHQAGIPFLYFGVEDHEGYHNPTDDYANITPDFYFNASTLILEVILASDAALQTLN